MENCIVPSGMEAASDAFLALIRGSVVGARRTGDTMSNLSSVFDRKLAMIRIFFRSSDIVCRASGYCTCGAPTQEGRS